MNKNNCSLIVVNSSKIHNNGVFAARDIPKGKKIIEYVGEKISKDEADKRAISTTENADDKNGAVYVFELNDKFDIDGNVPYNTARYINHSCEPNCVADIDGEHIWITALRKIKKDEELYYNYGYDLEDFEDHPCHCGSKKCVGYILDEEHWPKLKRFLDKKRSRLNR